MKPFTVILLTVCTLAMAGLIICRGHQKALSAPLQTAATTTTQTTASQLDNAPAATPATPTPQPVATQQADAPVPVTNTPVPSIAPTPSVSPIHKLVLSLLSAKSGADKRAVLAELRKDGQLDAAIADLKQMAEQNPNDAEIPTTIGEAELNECAALKEANASPLQMGVLALQADQEFDAALQIDPKNWEAQFVKASSMYYWPADPKTDNQVVQSLTQLIDQQGTMAYNPVFAQTYVVLGNEYQKIGQPDKAVATWQLGAQAFPGNTILQQKLASASGQ